MILRPSCISLWLHSGGVYDFETSTTNVWFGDFGGCSNLSTCFFISLLLGYFGAIAEKSHSGPLILWMRLLSFSRFASRRHIPTRLLQEIKEIGGLLKTEWLRCYARYKPGVYYELIRSVYKYMQMIAMEVHNQQAQKRAQRTALAITDASTTSSHSSPVKRRHAKGGGGGGVKGGGAYGLGHSEAWAMFLTARDGFIGYHAPISASLALGRQVKLL